MPAANFHCTAALRSICRLNYECLQSICDSSVQENILFWIRRTFQIVCLEPLDQMS